MTTQQLKRISTEIPSISPPVNQQQLMRACAGDITLAGQLLLEMKSIVALQIEEISQHARHDRFESVAEIAHSLKGAAAVLGAEQLHLATAALESAAHSEDEVSLLEGIREIRYAVKAFVEWEPAFNNVAAEFNTCRRCN